MPHVGAAEGCEQIYLKHRVRSLRQLLLDPNDNVIDKHIYRLRRKLDEGFSGSVIRTVQGAGYLLESEEPSNP